MKQYYILSKKNIIKKNKCYVLELVDTEKEANILLNSKHKDDGIIYYGDELMPYPIIENGKIRNLNILEMINKGIIKLKEDEYIKDNKIKSINNIPVPKNIIKPKFNLETESWDESATIYELEEIKKVKKEEEMISFYFSELNKANLFKAEYDFGLIGTITDFEEIKKYLETIYPFNKENKDQINIERPIILNRFDKLNTTFN